MSHTKSKLSLEYVTPHEYGSPTENDYETASESPAVKIRRVKRRPLTGHKFVGKTVRRRPNPKKPLRIPMPSASPVIINRDLSRRLHPEIRPVKITRDLSRRLQPEIRPVKITRDMSRRLQPEIRPVKINRNLTKRRHHHRPILSTESSDDEFQKLNLQELGNR